MQALLMAARAQAGDWRNAHVGDLMWAFFLVTCQLDPREHVRLWHDAEGRLVAYAILGVDPPYDWQVLPDFAGAGIEDGALAWAEALRARLCQSEPSRWSDPLVTGARQDDAARIAFLEGRGFRRGEYTEVNMLRSLSDALAQAPVPPGFEIRAVTGVAEAPMRALAEHIVWQPWSCGNISGDDYARLMALPGYERELDVVAVAPDGAIAAYVNGWLDPVNRIGDLGPVGALPDYRRRGLTRAVLIECLRRMRARGMERACVSTGEDNVPARGLYESVGFRVVNRYITYARPA